MGNIDIYVVKWAQPSNNRPQVNYDIVDIIILCVSQANLRGSADCLKWVNTCVCMHKYIVLIKKKKKNKIQRANSHYISSIIIHNSFISIALWNWASVLILSDGCSIPFEIIVIESINWTKLKCAIFLMDSTFHLFKICYAIPIWMQ